MNVNRSRVLAYVLGEDAAGRPLPTVRAICSALGIESTSTVHYHLKALERAGLVAQHRGWGAPRKELHP